jgi:chemotaxis methyl-accepting protein methylase
MELNRYPSAQNQSLSLFKQNMQARFMAKMDESSLSLSLTSRLFKKCLGAVLFQERRIWKHLPASLRYKPPGRAYGSHLHHMVCLQADRKQYFGTFFLRNRAELELIRRLIDKKPRGSRLDMSVLACSKGAEVYSMVWAIRSTRPDLQLNIHAIDISQEILDFAARGIYSFSNSDAVASSNEEAVRARGEVSWNTSRDQNAWIFERMTKEEIDAMFEVKGNQAHVRSWLKQGITWLCADAGDPMLQRAIGPQEIVIANRFLCHMRPPQAESCLGKIGQLVRPGGYLFVSGIDLKVRTDVALKMGWKPVNDLIREIHDSDTSIRRGWPMEYWGLEPFNDRRRDWQVRYASVFQIGDTSRAPAEPAVSQSSGR